MKQITLFLFFILVFFPAFSGEKYPQSGELQVGLRTTASVFGDKGYPGFGTGGQFRLRLSRMLNTEWFADYIQTDIGGLGRRSDGHIGWSVMFYPFVKDEAKLVPYLLAGHCFDYTRVTPFNTATVDRNTESLSRWSSATQAGLGMHWYLSPKFNLSFSGQYMVHLGKDIHAEVEEINGVKELHVEEHPNQSLEGHLLLTMSLNVRLGDLW